MAYMNQERKKQIKAELDMVLKPAKIKYSLAVRHHSTIVLNIKSGPVDFLSDYAKTLEGNRYRLGAMGTEIHVPSLTHADLNPYHWRNEFTNESIKELLGRVFTALNNGNHDNSDAMVDYFDVGWYVDVNIGKYNKPYELTA
jgi:hypothetical protein